MNQRKRAICLCLLTLNVLFIWGNSLLPQETSAAFSQWVGAIVDWLTGGSAGASQGTGHGILRKVAHFMEFCSLGFLLHWLFVIYNKVSWRKLLLPFAIGVSVACVDETLQLLMPGRGPGVRDVCIDAAGVAVGILILQLWIMVKKKRT